MLRFTPTGKSMAKLRVSRKTRHKDEATGKWVDGEIDFVDVVCWGVQAENAAESLRAKDRVVAYGMWQEELWFGHDGQWHERRSLTAQEIGPSLLFTTVRVRRDKEGG